MASANINCSLLDLSPDFPRPFIFPPISPPIMGTINDLQPNQTDSYVTHPLSINVFNDSPSSNDLPHIPAQALSISVFNDLPNSNMLNNTFNDPKRDNEPSNTNITPPSHNATQPLSINIFNDLPNNTHNKPPNTNQTPPHNATQPLSINVFNDLPKNTLNNPPNSSNIFNDLPNIFNNALNNKDIPSPTQPLSINIFNDLPSNVFKDLTSTDLPNIPQDLPTNIKDKPIDKSNPRFTAQALSKFYGVNENMLNWNNDNFARVQINMMQIPEEQLTVNVDSDEGGMHSWRPNLINSLTSDVFVAQPGLSNVEKPKVFSWDSVDQEVTKNEGKNSDLVSRGGTEYPGIDVQNHLQTQRTQLNSLKYEVINEKRRLNETQALVAKLSLELEEKLLFKNSKEMKTLRDENAELRLECQCLCTEVDFYLRGKAPLGEIDDTFWESFPEDSKAATGNTAQAQISTEQQLYNSEEQEEKNKWECRLCTFANHPAITSCEMCHLSRDTKETTQLHSTEACYCHPNKESDSS